MKKILVIGESNKDIFIYCEADRLAPDLPVPVLHILRSTENPGMAKNVERNILSIYPNCDILTNGNWDSVTKSRYIHEKSNHMFLRVDSPHNIEPLDIREISFDYDLIVIADYNKGFLTEDIIEYICKNHNLVLLDTKKPLGKWAEEATFIKINDYEFLRSLPEINQSLMEKIIHTRDKLGCTFRGKDYSVAQVEVMDTSGAGDTFMAGFAVRYLLSGDIEESIEYANQCASEAVKKRGVNTI